MNLAKLIGIPVDSNGFVQSVWSWPWYWRYPAAIVVCALTAAVFYPMTSQGHHPPAWQLVAVLAVGGLLALSIAYEVLAVCVVIAALWGAWALVADHGSDLLLIALFGVGVAIAVEVHAARKEMQQIRRMQADLADRMDQLPGELSQATTTRAAPRDWAEWDR